MQGFFILLNGNIDTLNKKKKGTFGQKAPFHNACAYYRRNPLHMNAFKHSMFLTF